MRRKVMTAKKIIVAAALLFGATSAALAQSAWTDGSAADRARAGFASSYGSGIYAYAPGSISGQAGGRGAYAMVPPARAGSIDDPALTGGGSTGYNALVRQEW
jgi:hypothetical protein